MTQKGGWVSESGDYDEKFHAVRFVEVNVEYKIKSKRRYLRKS
jgi:hypothetical protein